MNHSRHTTIASALPTLLLLWGTVFITINTRTVFGPLSENISTAFGIPGYEVVALSSLISIGNIISLIFSGHVAYVLMHTRTLILALMLIIAGLLLAASAPALFVFKTGLVFIGVGAGLYPGSGIPIANAMCANHIRSNAIAIHETGPVGAYVFVPLLSSLVLLVASWRAVLVVLAFMCVFLAVFIFISCKEGYFRGKPLTLKNMKTLVSLPTFVLLVMAFAVVGAVNMVVYTSMVDFFVVFKGLNHNVVTLVQSLSRISGLVIIFFSGVIMSRMPASYIAAFTGCIAGVLTALMGILSGSEVFVIVFLQMFVMSGFFPAVLVAAGKFFPGSLQGLVITLMVLGSQFANIAINMVYSMFAERGSLNIAFIVMGCMVMVVSLVFLSIKKCSPFIESDMKVAAAAP